MAKMRYFAGQNRAILLFSFLFSIWALAFIYHSSYIASDGRLYFNLFDDAMISMRYAWNLAHGNGLVWNAGEYVEGYTNLLMTLLMTAASFFLEKRYAVLFIQLTGILFMLGTAFFTLKIFEIVTPVKSSRAGGYILFAAILLYYPLNYWALLGMETGLLAMLLSAGVLCSFLYLEKLETKYLWLMTVCFGLAYLTRNDSLLFAALTFLHLTSTLKVGRKTIFLFFASGLTYGLFPIGQTLFRYLYYGQVVPNTYTLKLVGMALDERLHNGWGFVQPFLKETGWILIIAVLGLFLKPSRQKFYLFGVFLISITYQIYVGGDPWTYWRIMAPTMPFIFLLFISSLEEIANRIPTKFHQTTYYIPLIVLVAIGLYQTDSRFFKEMSLQELPFDVEASHKHMETAIAINELTKETATIGVFWAGTLPYHTNRTAIDFLGKSDVYIANLPPDTSGTIAWEGMNSVPGHNKYDLTYSIQGLLPTYVDDLKWGTQDLTAWGQDHYVLVHYNKTWLLLLKDSPDVHWDKVNQE
jgi:arabinofuranosyltransferase